MAPTPVFTRGDAWWGDQAEGLAPEAMWSDMPDPCVGLIQGLLPQSFSVEHGPWTLDLVCRAMQGTHQNDLRPVPMPIVGRPESCVDIYSDGSVFMPSKHDGAKLGVGVWDPHTGADAPPLLQHAQPFHPDVSDGGGLLRLGLPQRTVPQFH